MKFKAESLTEEIMLRNLQSFITISKNNIDGEYWSKVNFLAPLKRKWELSLYVSDNSKKIIAFLIASEKDESIHIHKFVVHHSAQQNGIGTLMLNHVKKIVAKPITLKVHVNNKNAIGFYLRRGFVIQTQQIDTYLLTHNFV